MSETVVIAIVTGIVTIVVAIVGGIFALLRQGRETRVAIDGRLTELLDAARDLARSEGIAQGEQDERDRNAP